MYNGRKAGVRATATDPAGHAHDDARVLAAKVEILAKQWTIISVVHLLVASVAAIVLWGHFPVAWILGWYGCALLVTMLRLGLLRRFGSAADRPVSARTRAVVYLVVAGVSGLFWGLLAILFLDLQNLTLSVFIVCILIGMVAGALPSMAALVPVYYAFSTPLILLLSVKMALVTTGTDYYWLVVLILAFWVSSSLFARNLQQTITTSITIDLRNTQLLAELTVAKEQAEQANRAKSQFLAAASHDLRQPLHAMGFFIDTLRDRLESATNRQLFENIASAHVALESLFSALLEISKLDSGGVKPQVCHFALHPLLQELCRTFAAEASSKHVALELVGPETVVQSDPVLLARVLGNLISNAVRYTPEGRVRVLVEASALSVKVLVEDTGIGIPENELDNIFSEYHQLDNVERDRSKGLGLGLAVVRRMANLLDHPIDVRSELGRGSVFSIELPAGTPSYVACEPEPVAKLSLAGKRVLVVDDERSILDAMQIVLEKWGCQVSTAMSMQEALAELQDREYRVDLIVTDYRLRNGETGMALIETIRHRSLRQVPALLMSGDTDKALLRNIRQHGFYLLHKPIKPAHLFKTMSDLL